MFRKTWPVLLLLFVSLASYAQDSFGDNIQILLSPGDSLRRLGLVNGAIKLYRQRYQEDAGDIVNAYNYSCAFAVSKQIDSAFKYLRPAIEKDSTLQALVDPDLIHLYNDERWNEIQNEIIEKFQLKSGKLKKVELAKKLLEIKALDQAYLEEIDQAQEKMGRDCAVVDALWDLKDRINKKNLKEVEEIITSNTWPKISDVGTEGAEAVFLVIQHADINAQKKYLPVIKKLCEDNEAPCENYALMYDRVEVAENNRQLYGTQVKWSTNANKYVLYPILDEKNVDERRLHLGLMPIAQYLITFGIQYKPQ
jgi:hypothetical protein